MDGFTFFTSYYDAIKELTEEEQGALYVAIMRYVFDDIEPELSGVMKMVFTLMRPNLDTSKNRSNKGKAGRKKSKVKNKKESNENQNEIKTESMTSIEKNKDKEMDKDNKPPISPFSEIVDKWNELSDIGIAPIERLTDKRKTLLGARVREYTSDKILVAIDKIRASDFLQGKNNRGWMITFDWFLKPTNFPKVLEGNYSNKGGGLNGNGATEGWGQIADTSWGYADVGNSLESDSIFDRAG